jgi:hypothetical protein
VDSEGNIIEGDAKENEEINLISSSSSSFSSSSVKFPSRVGKIWIGRSVIKSCLRLNYSEAQRLMMGERNVVRFFNDDFYKSEEILKTSDNGMMYHYYPSCYENFNMNFEGTVNIDSFLGKPVLPSENDIANDLMLIWKFVCKQRERR